jgi:hypothetical protein
MQLLSRVSPLGMTPSKPPTPPHQLRNSVIRGRVSPLRMEQQAANSATQALQSQRELETIGGHRMKSDRCRRYACRVAGCNRAFYRMEHLKRHVRTHTGEKPHACLFDGCTKRFSRTDELKRHSMTHLKKKGSQVGKLSRESAYAETLEETQRNAPGMIANRGFAKMQAMEELLRRPSWPGPRTNHRLANTQGCKQPHLPPPSALMLPSSAKGSLAAASVRDASAAASPVHFGRHSLGPSLHYKSDSSRKLEEMYAYAILELANAAKCKKAEASRIPSIKIADLLN